MSTPATDPTWLWNPGQALPEIQNKGINGFTKKVLCGLKLWGVLNRFDSEAAAWVSGAAETVDYFG